MAGFNARTRMRFCTAAVIFLCPPSALQAQDDSGFRLPIEVFQGAALDAPGTIKPFQAGIALLPSWSFDPVRLGVKLALDYDDPSWRGRFGPRLSSRVVPLLRSDIGLILGAEATASTSGDMRYAANLTFDVDGLIRMGLAGGWQDLHDGSWFVGLTLGADPTRWLSCVKDDFTGECLEAGGQGENGQAGRGGGKR